MDATGSASIIEDYLTHIGNKTFPCIAAKTALAKEQIHCMVAEHLACPIDDSVIVQFLYDFVDEYRRSRNLYNSAVVLFKGPEECDEEMFDNLLWQRLQAISNLDAVNYKYDSRVDADPESPKFSFSLKEEAVYIIGLHPMSSRKSRQFRHPALVFNPHGQFEKLRQTNKYNRMRQVVRSRDLNFSGSVNPMLADFGEESEVFQYSGRNYNKNWKCPLILNHADIKSNLSS